MQRLTILICFLLLQFLAKGDELLSKIKFGGPTDSLSSEWINSSTLLKDSETGILFSRTDSSHTYGLGFKGAFPQNCLSKSLTVSIHAKVRFASINSEYAIAMSVAHSDSTIIWDSKDVKVSKFDKWTAVNVEFQIPASFVVDANSLFVYGYNKNGKSICDLYDLEISLYEHESESFLPAVNLFADKGKNLNYIKITNGEKFSVLLDSINRKVKIISAQGDSLYSDLGFYLEYLKKQSGKKSKIILLDHFDRFSVEGNDNRIKLHLFYKSKVANLNVLIDVDNITGYVSIKPDLVFKSDLFLKRAALIFRYNVDLEKVYCKNGDIDSVTFRNEYWLEKEGLMLKGKSIDFLSYRNQSSSSMQLCTKEKYLLFNLDYELDHPFLHYPMMKKSLMIYKNRSAIHYKIGQTLSGNLKFNSVEKNKTITRVMKNPNGFLSSLIWTEHADFSDIKIQRALNFGSERIHSSDSAIGGFVGHGIPVTKSVFYDNPTNLKNSEKDIRFPENSLSIKGSSEFAEFLNQLKGKNHEICLHTPDPFTTNRVFAESAMEYMQQNFGTVNWIDHGYDNRKESNREDIVCSGLDSTSDFFMADLWKKYRVNYFWNDFYEDVDLYSKATYYSFLTTPYSGWDEAYPTPEYFKNPIDKSFISWRTTFTLDPADGSLWNYYFNTFRLNDFVNSRGNCVLHCYPARVDSTTGFYSYSENTIVVNPEFDSMLERLYDYSNQGKIWLTTVKEMLDYRLQLDNVVVQTGQGNSMFVYNNSDKAISGLSLITDANAISAGEKNIRIKKEGNQLIAIIDLAPREKLFLELK